MTTIAVDARTFHLRVPVLWLGRVRGSLVVRVTEQIELHVERHDGRRRTPRSAAFARAQAVARVEASRTAALAHRLPCF